MMRNSKRSSKVCFNLSKGFIKAFPTILDFVLAPVLTICLFTDPDTPDEEPSEHLIDLYYYKCEQLCLLMGKVYNSDDVKFLYSKLVKSQWATMLVSFSRMILWPYFFFHFSIVNYIKEYPV